MNKEAKLRRNLSMVAKELAAMRTVTELRALYIQILEDQSITKLSWGGLRWDFETNEELREHLKLFLSFFEGYLKRRWWNIRNQPPEIRGDKQTN